ncbi:MAG: AbrB/MazE/SpoVT family DNA-binding domain-containing protein [Candidatus Thiodiazotropha sp. (ex Lucinoma aequizonata)]|nr:AbrB/MazE/SpoVT family DNA-binding domain-containing protein [Candidatus Thiodiazotropha sp. (ex Lucinoma aequizonata)]MCU7888841.1 AbrB/MazE/SpoVT family DNA-binding domain-containing protein [Candidatus Thiodiazotropha sp. (ex Lucinoma aequizonata)]MCU7894752.1 AbrB/MazE/SpoVT family DNA-binding domain-containing protein [Candidatus Thiodiazotropha sp. (ex Lucinoma aequizonata)]MCU7899400.1 AbrB/MazE/SpoVT family DNA-binding domain-containing protein [Candidatus Thiodiazotropha sp. (ex Luci
MVAEGKIQKWGNSSAIRLPAKVLVAAGIDSDSKVDIQADSGRVVIQLHERTLEQQFDKLLADEPGAAELMAVVKEGLTKAIALTDETTESCYALIERLEQKEGE